MAIHAGIDTLSEFSSQTPGLMIGKQIAQFVIQEKLGEGGMGVVYKALDQRLNRPVALKFLPTQLSSDETAKKRFMQEAQAASRLDHANICTIYEIGETKDGQLFIAMAFYDGQTLKYLMNGTAMSDDQVRSIGLQLSKALKRAHRAGITHRDIKPANIMVTSDKEVKLLDFGLAKLAGSMDLTVMGSTVGTAAYMSPEQMKGSEVGTASDVWSLGAVLYEMTTGKKPFTVDYDQALMYAILNEDPEPVQQVHPDAPSDVASLIDACLNKDATRRPTMESIRDVLGDDSSSSRAVVESAQSRSLMPRNALIAAAVVVVALLGILFFPSSDADSTDATVSQASMVNQQSIAVLPFSYQGADSEEATVFTVGVHNDILHQLSKIADLTVIASSSVLQYEGTSKTMSEIAEELNVRSIMQGTVQKAGDRVRISTTLVEASTGVQLWSATHDEVLSVENMFAIQTQLATDIAEALEAELTAEDRARLAEGEDVSQEAYDLMNRADYLRTHGNFAGTARQIEDMYLQVIEQEPEFARAHAFLATLYLSGFSTDIWSVVDKMDEVRFHNERAYELAPDAGYTLIAQARVALHDMAFDKAEERLLRAIEVDPGNASVYTEYSNLLYTTGRPNEALYYARKALEMDPLSIRMRVQLADVLFFIGRYQESIDESRKVLQLEPRDSWSYYNIGYGLAMLDRNTEAIANFQKAVEFSPEEPYLTLGLAWAYARANEDLKAVSLLIEVEDTPSFMKEKAIIYGVMEDLDNAFLLLERVYEQNPAALLIIAGDDSVPEAMRQDPRFEDLLDRLGLEAS